MDLLLATFVEDFAQLKAQASRMDTYGMQARWLVIGEDSPTSRAFLKAYSLKRNQPSYFLPLSLARKISPLVFSGRGGAFNAALLCSAVTGTPIVILDGVTFASREWARLQALESDAVAGCCTGCPDAPAAHWAKNAEAALAAWEQKITSKGFCREQLRRIASCAPQEGEAGECEHAIFVQPEAAASACFSPKSERPFALWKTIAERMGKKVARPKRPWVCHLPSKDSLKSLEKAWRFQQFAETEIAAADMVFRKASFRTYSDFVLDGACAAAIAERGQDPLLFRDTVEKIVKLADGPLLDAFAALAEPPPKPELGSLRENGRAYFNALRDWKAVIRECREKKRITFLE